MDQVPIWFLSKARVPVQLSLYFVKLRLIIPLFLLFKVKLAIIGKLIPSQKKDRFKFFLYFSFFSVFFLNFFSFDILVSFFNTISFLILAYYFSNFLNVILFKFS